MLDTSADQGESLRRIAPQAAWSVIAMVTRGDTATELPLLWQICAALQSFSLRITVLDASSAETEDNPGLLNLLDHAHWQEDAADDPPHEAPPWHVVPARLGLSRLALQTRQDSAMSPAPLQALSHLSHLFRSCDLVVVYADAQLLATLMPGSQIRPLLAVTPRRASIIGAYQNFKKLLLQARLVPLIASVVTAPFRNAELQARNTGRTLQNCAHLHLDCQTDFMTVRSFPQQHARWDDAHQIALRLMASAIPMVHGVGSR
ncbi:MAG: hypothetical protein ABIP34_04320 [Rhodoferax sp.]|uniref:hypothetical protein n=1 Tax=Rhodoferax sp. TaxID=50421 RepID=UPI0032667C72